MTKEQEKKLLRRVALAGAILGMLCHFLPPEYQVACRFVSNACTGGL